MDPPDLPRWSLSRGGEGAFAGRPRGLGTLSLAKAEWIVKATTYKS
jgi:hypothetical protein